MSKNKLEEVEEPMLIAEDDTSVEVTIFEPTEELVTEDDSGLVLNVAETLVAELKSSPNLAINLVHTLSQITKPWEPIGSDGKIVNEIAVPPGQSPKDFKKQTTMQASYISGYKMSTIFGDEVAVILKDTPKWKIMIEGDYQSDAPFVEHSQKAEASAKSFAEAKLVERGYIIG